MRPRDHLDRLAAQRGGVLSVRRTAEAGISPATFHRWVNARGAERVAPGVAIAAPAKGSMDRTKQRLQAALEANWPGAALAGRSALWARGLLERPEPARVLVDAPRNVVEVEGVQVRRANRKIGLRVEVVGGWPVCGLPHALLDLARESDDVTVLSTLCAALRTGSNDLDEVRRCLETHPGMHGGGTLGRALDRLVGIRPDAASEVLVREALALAGLPTEPAPRTVATPLGRFQVDVVLDGTHVGIECDSVTFHGNSASLERDHRKTNALALAGWTLLRVSHRQAVTNLDDLVAAVRAAVAATV